MKGRFVILGIALLMLAIIPASVSAKKPDLPPRTTAAKTTSTVTGTATGTASRATGKVTMCHRTGSAKKPWVKVVVSASSRKAHEKHGDFVLAVGAACPTTRSTSTSTSTTTTSSTVVTTSTTSAVTSVTTAATATP